MFPGMGGMGGGGLALNQLLVQMDGIGEAPFMRQQSTKRLNTLLDAMYFIPRRIGKVSLRLPPPKPAQEQVFFIGATNVPIDRLDPALIRPGRMGAPRVVPDADARGPQGHLQPVPVEGRPRSPTSTPTAAATSWPGSPTATRRR